MRSRSICPVPGHGFPHDQDCGPSHVRKNIELQRNIRCVSQCTNVADPRRNDSASGNGVGTIEQLIRRDGALLINRQPLLCAAPVKLEIGAADPIGRLEPGGRRRNSEQDDFVIRNRVVRTWHPIPLGKRCRDRAFIPTSRDQHRPAIFRGLLLPGASLLLRCVRLYPGRDTSPRAHQSPRFRNNDRLLPIRTEFHRFASERYAVSESCHRHKDFPAALSPRRQASDRAHPLRLNPSLVAIVKQRRTDGAPDRASFRNWSIPRPRDRLR